EKINEAKKIAAYEITKLIHGEEEAIKAKKTSEDLFENKSNNEDMPIISISRGTFVNDEISILDILISASVAPSKGQARILVSQGGISIDDVKITNDKAVISTSDFEKGYIVLRKGKKVFLKIIIE
ncbi:MAG: tyrosine--tRNA ligase, partial [Clostridia bacterium]|nr:tyrosine--tRNA ligase [Clostridia bacterium]